MVAVQPIRTAMLRLDPTTSCFTSTHTLFARLCLEARAYRFSCPILDNDIYHFPTSLAKNPINAPLLCAKHDSSSAYINSASGLSDTLNHKDHLQYFLYGAMLYIGMKRWDRALLFLEFAIISPTGNTASMIQVEAYKKWVLLGLVLKGSVSERLRMMDSGSLIHGRPSLCRCRELPMRKPQGCTGRSRSLTTQLQKSSKKGTLAG